MTERAAVIDIGTNSIKLLVAERSGPGFNTLVERTAVTRLGEGLSKSGRLSDAAMRRAEDVITRFADLAGKLGVGTVTALGTQALRQAANGTEFARKLEKDTGVKLRVLSGEEEARYSFTAAVEVAPESARTLVFDAGGGSTEFILGTARVPELAYSAPVGALTLYDECMAKNDPPSEENVKDASLLAMKILRQADGVVDEARKKDFVLVGAGGIIAVLSSVSMELTSFNADKVNGAVLSAEEVRAQIKVYCSRTAEQRKQIQGMPEDRAVLAPAGAALALAVLEYTGKETLKVSVKGFRHGVMAELMGKIKPRPPA